jgi:hypothetical protein
MKARHCHPREKGDGVLGDPSESLADAIIIKGCQVTHYWIREVGGVCVRLQALACVCCVFR